MLRRVARLPILPLVTPGSQMTTLGAQTATMPPVSDEQSFLPTDLVEAMSRDIPSLGHILEIIERRLAGACGVRAATVLTLDPDDGSLRVAAVRGPAAANDLAIAGRVFRVAAGAPGVRAGDRTAIRLRIGGQTTGVLVLTGDTLDALRPEVASAAALQLAATLQVLASERQRQYTSHATATIRRLFEEGAAAASVEDAGRLLARSTAEAFRSARAAAYLVDPDGTIRHVIGIGLSEPMNAGLTERLVGRPATESPIWRAVLAAGEPLLIDDTAGTHVRPGGVVETLGLQSMVAMPLMSTAGPAGLVLCGDPGGTRRWSGRDRDLARQLALEGALLVDGARLRQAEQQHVAELTRQAFHDALTGLANRSHLLDRAEAEVAAATATGERLALLLIDLDGFKKINDTVGHHAGDALLQAVGRRLQHAVRHHDLVARLGGDEFAVLLTRDPDQDAAAAIARRLHERLCTPFTVEGRRVNVGASIGIALFPEQAGDMGALMRGSDAAMYRAKRDGGGVLS